MTDLEIILIILLWFILGLFLCKKQAEVSNTNNRLIYHEGFCIIIIATAPLYLIGSIIAQVFVAKWKDVSL